MGRQSYAKNVIFFLKKRIKEIFAYILEFMLTFDKMQNASPLMCAKHEICGQSSSFSYCTHVALAQ